MARHGDDQRPFARDRDSRRAAGRTEAYAKLSRDHWHHLRSPHRNEPEDVVTLSFTEVQGILARERAVCGKMRLVPHAELHIFPNCGHWAMIERKKEFENVLNSSLK